VKVPVFFDAERLKYPNTGLYHFCLQLGQAIANQCAVTFFTRNDALSPRVPVHFWHKWWLRPVSGSYIWHATHQDTEYMPTGSGAKVVLTIQDLNYLHDGRKSEAKKQRFKAQLQSKINRADYLVFISAYTQRDVQAHFELGDTPQQVIPNGCNLTDVPADLPYPLLAAGRPFLFTIGTIAEKKNFHVLPSLLVGNDRLLIIAGITQQAHYLEKIKQEAHDLGVSDRVIFAGAVSEQDKIALYRHCEVFVFPSVAEGFGLPVVEAMHLGKPVFLSQFTSLPEVGGPEAYYFTDFDAQSMRETLRQGLQDYQVNDKKQSIQAWTKQFDWSVAAASYAEVYAKLAERM
jgi:glycosyltransferase involved in cell wall biosynthesis